MNKTMKIILAVVGVILIIAIPIITSYNSLVTQRNNVDEQWANVESKLQRRYDLIPNLVNSVQGAMNQEKDVFKSIADARAKLSSASSVNDKVEANNELDSAVSRLLVVVENYPELKSNDQVTGLMDELAGTENRISVERDKFNGAVKTYNSKIQKFPGSIIAGMFGFEKYDYFKATAGAETAPSVNLE